MKALEPDSLLLPHRSHNVPLKVRGSVADLKSPRVQKGWAISVCDWTWELVGLLLAAALLTAILVFMRWYDGYRQTEVIITLNSIVAILSTFLRALLAFIMTAVLSQTMWSWFREARPVSHINQFHSAIQGTWGAIKLLFTVLRPNLALLCVLGLTATYGIGPFTQQAIQSVDCQRVAAGRNATIPVSNYVDNPDLSSNDDPADPFNKVTGNAVYGFITPELTQLPAIQSTVDCPGGNCTFQAFNGVTHSSLGMCTKCVDISDLITPWEPEQDKPRPKIFRPGEHDAASPSHQKAQRCEDDTDMALTVVSGMPMEWALPVTASHPDFQAALASSFANVSFLSYTRDPQYTKGFVNVICTVYPCVHDFHGEVRDGVLKEDVVSVTAMKVNWTRPQHDNIGSSDVYDFGASHIKMPCAVDGQLYDWNNVSSCSDKSGVLEVPSPSDPAKTVTIPKQCAYLIGHDYGFEMNQYYRNTMSGMCSCWVEDNQTFTHCQGFSQDDTNLCVSTPCRANMSPFLLEPFFNATYASFESIAALMERIANATTVRLRLFGKDSAAIPSMGYKDADLTSYGQLLSGQVYGRVIESGVCYRIDWMWLIFPCALVLLSSLCLFIIVWESHTMRKNNLPVWKANVLPLLFHGIIGRDNGSHGFQGIVELAEMEKRAEGMNVVFLGDGFYSAKA